MPRNHVAWGIMTHSHFCSSLPGLEISVQPPTSRPNRAQNARLPWLYICSPTYPKQTEQTTPLFSLIWSQILQHWYYSPCMIHNWRKSILVLICVCMFRFVCVSARICRYFRRYFRYVYVSAFICMYDRYVFVSACICRYVRYVWVCTARAAAGPVTRNGLGHILTAPSLSLVVSWQLPLPLGVCENIHVSWNLWSNAGITGAARHSDSELPAWAGT